MQKILNTNISGIKFAKYRFSIELKQEVSLPAYHGSLLRGAFGSSLKKVVCIKRQADCQDCMLIDKCAYNYIFETSPPDDTARMKNYTSVPRPFIIEPEGMEGKNLYFNFVLIGKGIDYFPYIVYTIIEMGKNSGLGRDRHKFILNSVEFIDANNNYNNVYNKEENKLLTSYSPLCLDDFISPTRIKLEFLTWARIKANGRYVDDMDFTLFIKNLLRRLSALAYFHCNTELNLDFKELINESKNIKTIEKHLYWEDWTRYSNRAKTKMLLGGIKGYIVFEGDLEIFYPFIVLGEHLHIGKEATFGLGRYSIYKLRGQFL